MKDSPQPHRARKRFGQNFLQDPGIINRIAKAIHAKPDQHLVEIGPGQGALTKLLVDTGCLLDAIELDRDLIPVLQQQFSGQQFRLHQADALRFDFHQLQTSDEKLRVVGNLPYNISTPLIFHLLDHQALISDMHFMLQLEVVNRLAANPGHKNYGRLSVMTQYFCEVSALFEVPPEAFSPRPKVQSAIVRLSPRAAIEHPANNMNTFTQLLRSAFNQRRKTLRNNLKGLLSPDAITAVGIDPGARPETLSVAEFVALSNAVDDLTEC